ncbi:ABC transporter substrate binding protein [Nitrospirota bacterium]
MRVLLIKAMILCLVPGILLQALSAEAGRPVVGIILPATDTFSLRAHEAFMERLRTFGLKDSISIIEQSPHPDPIALKNTARKLITLKADFIVTYGTPSTISVIGEKFRKPIISGGVYKPIHDTISGPQYFGVCINPPLSSMTRYMAASSKDKNVGILYCSNEKDSLFQMEQMMRFSSMAGLTGKPLDMKAASKVSSNLSGSDVGFFFITTSSCTHASSLAIERISVNRKIPIATLIDIEGLNPVIAHYCEASEVGRMMADNLKVALEGGSPPRTSSPCPTSAELIFNIGEARRLGLTMPMELVTGATKVIY